MTDLNLNVRFETVSDDLAKAFVNDVYVGRIKMRGEKLVFRCSDNPFTNVVAESNRPYGETVPELLEVRRVVENLTPIVIRNYLRNFGFLNERLSAA